MNFGKSFGPILSDMQKLCFAIFGDRKCILCTRKVISSMHGRNHQM